MKTLLSPRNLKLLIPGCGILGLLLRILLAATGTDGKGLIVSNHPAWIALLALTCAVFAALLLSGGTIRGAADYRASFPRSVPAPVAGVAAAIAAIASLIRHLHADPVIAIPPNIMTTAAFWLSGAIMVLAAIAFILAGLCRLTERKVPFGLHVVICIWFALEMLNLYQAWSFDPQLQDYCFQLFCAIALAITAYQLACFDIGRGSHRKLWFWALAATYLCCLCLDSGLFYIAGADWAWSNLTTLRRRQRKTMGTEIPTAE